MRKSDFDDVKRHLKAGDTKFIRTRSPFYQTVRMLARYYARMNGVLKPSGIDMARWRVLMALSDTDRMAVSAIAEECVVQISTMTKTVARMESEGLVTLRTSKRDARATDVAIAPAGRELLERNREKVAYVFEEALRGLSKTEIRLLNSISARIFENITP